MRRKSIIVFMILSVLSIAFALASCSMGSNETVSGTYYLYVNGEYDASVYIRFENNMWYNNENKSGTFYIDGEYINISGKSCVHNGDEIVLDNYTYKKNAELDSLPLASTLAFTLGLDNTYSVSGMGGLSGDIVVPSTYKGKAVTVIGEYAFRDCADLTSIEIPQSITAIEYMAFEGCTGLTNIVIPKSVTYIGFGAFSGCNNLECMTLPFIGTTKNTTRQATLRDIFGDDNDYIIGGGVPVSLDTVIVTTTTVIGDNAFAYCGNVTNIQIPNNVTSIGSYAFYGCSNLTSIDIPNSVTNIGNYAFYFCDRLTSMEIPNNVTSIGSYAFRSCSNLTSIEIPKSVANIGSGLFIDCRSLTIYCEVESKPDGWNRYWHQLDADSQNYCPVVWDCKNNDRTSSGFVYAVIDGIRYSLKDGVATVVGQPHYILNATIPESVTYSNEEYRVTSIGSEAFYNCSRLTSIEISNSISKIGNSAFYNCFYLTDMEIPNSVITIGKDAFYQCTRLIQTENELIYVDKWIVDCDESAVSAQLRANTVGIIDYAFDECSNLVSIDIPNTVTRIGQYSFQGCSKLETINVDTDNPNYSSQDGILYNKSNTEIVHVPLAINGVIILPDSITNIVSYAFSGRTGLTNIQIPSSCTSIGDSAFNGCNNLESIMLPLVMSDFGSIFGARSYSYNSRYVPTSLKAVVITNATDIRTNAFYGCSSITSIELPDGVTSIGDYAFYGCSGLTSIELPDGVTSIGDYAFYGCSGLTNIEMPNSVMSIGYYAFNSCNGLTSIKIPNSITSINGSAFYNCRNIISATIPTIAIGTIQKTKLQTVVINGGESIGEMAFDGCSSLTSIEIPNSVTSIGNSAFYNCSGLTSIEIPNSVTSIGSSAFRGCSSLTSITLPFLGNTKYGTNNTHFGYIFGASSYDYNSGYVPTSLQSVIITEGTSIGNYAFYNCSSLTSVVIPDIVTSIGGGAFENCSSLTSIVVPDSVTNIGMGALSTHSDKFDIYYAGDVASWCGITFESIILLSDTYQLFINDEIVNELFIPDTVTKINDYAFANCKSLTSVVIGSGVTSIGEYAFEVCDNLTSVVIGNCVTSIGDCAFYRCDNLISVEFGDSVTSIGQYAFADCGSIKDIVLSSAVRTIGFCAFKNCKRLESIDMPSLLVSIEEEAFYDCSSLEKIWISSSVTTIGHWAFGYCSRLTIYCQGTGPRSGWSAAWNTLRVGGSNPNYYSIYCPVEWGRSKI